MHFWYRDDVMSSWWNTLLWWSHDNRLSMELIDDFPLLILLLSVVKLAFIVVV